MQAQRQLTLWLACLPVLSHAAPDCSIESNTARHVAGLGPQHHPMSKPLPRNAGYYQPDACGDGAWFYDLNRNGRPDVDEPRLYGPERVIECESCHDISPDASNTLVVNRIPRIHAGELCVVCHSK